MKPAPWGSSRLGPLWLRIAIALAIVALIVVFTADDDSAVRHFFRLLVRNLLR